MDIVFSQDGGLGHILLSREKALNALSGEMVLEKKRQLEAWATDASIKAVMIEGAGDKAFCAGGDIRAIYEGGQTDLEKVISFFRAEYNTNALIHYYPKPYIAIIGGIAMGGGVGVSSHGSHVIVTEKAMLAMPENTIGFIPDVGTSYILSRAPGHLGAYLAMTGARMSASDAIYAGFATHFIPADKITSFKQAVINSMTPEEALNQFAETPPESQLKAQQPFIDEIFHGDSAIDIMQRLEHAHNQGNELADKLLKAMLRMSPTSLACSLRAVLDAKTYETIEDCLANEFRFAVSALRGTEFYEGIRALIVDKDNQPNWNPSSIEKVNEKLINACFAPLGAEEWHYEKNTI